ncbi:Hypothetical protein A7982_08768 [Minicystis rosea]|nr:Hypothetical protein A7982_08768 [Minicystis rosea]
MSFVSGILRPACMEPVSKDPRTPRETISIVRRHRPWPTRSG